MNAQVSEEKIISTTTTIVSSCFASVRSAFSLLSMILLLTACSSGVKQNAIPAPMKFTVPGGDRLLRMVDDSSIEARFTLLLDGQQSPSAVTMSRIDTSNQWQSSPVTIPPNVGFLIQLSWYADDIDGVNVEYAFQSFRSIAGINSNQPVDLSTVPYSFDFDNDEDGVNNYQELLAGTSTVNFDDDTTDADSPDMGVVEGATDADTGTTATGTGTLDTGTGDTGTGDTDMSDAGSDTAGLVDDGVITPSGGIVGAWFGNNNFGEGVMIVDVAENVYALAANGNGQYETVFGPASGALERFIHRDSDNPSFADSFTLVGDSPSSLSNTIDSDTIAYNLSVENDGQQINHNGEGGDFSMTFANENDLVPISLASIGGSWIAKTSFCAADCNITLEMTFTASGELTGFTQFNDNPSLPLSGTVSVAEDATQYLNIEFIWNETPRTGVVYVDRLDPTRLIINTIGPGFDDASRSFTASMIRR